MQVEHGTFIPLVRATTGGLSRKSRKFYFRLAEEISEKRKLSYYVVATWIPQKITFALIKSFGMCHNSK